MDNEQPISFEVFQDWNANAGNPKGRLLMVAFRLAYLLRNYHKVTFLAGAPFLILHRIFFEWFLGVELPHKTRIGRGLRLHHGVGLVVNDGAIIGRDCTLRQNTTIGNKMGADGLPSACPRLGDRVDVGSNVVIIGPVTVGDDVVIGAGSVVVKDVPANSYIAGNPAKILERK